MEKVTMGRVDLHDVKASDGSALHGIAIAPNYRLDVLKRHRLGRRPRFPMG
jgi:hypothetical protein